MQRRDGLHGFDVHHDCVLHEQVNAEAEINADPR
jgi:hypothetical protein